MLGHDPLPGPLLTLDTWDQLVARAVLTRASQLRAQEQQAVAAGQLMTHVLLDPDAD